MNQLSKQFNKLPTSTGAGLFIERAKFEVLGTPPTLLHVSLPTSSVLNVRSRCLIGANGDLNQLENKLELINLWSKPLIYNQVSSTTPLSLFLSNSKNIVNLELVKDDEWIVMNTDDVIGWYGDLQLSNATANGVKFVANDQGNLLLTGSSQVFTIQLDNEESISVNPGALIAHTGTTTPISYNKLVQLPRFGVWNTIKLYYNEVLKIAKTQTDKLKGTEVKGTDVKGTDELKGTEVVKIKEPSGYDNIKEWLTTKISTISFKNKLFYEIKGPATILIQNDVQSLSSTFTEGELKEIYKSIK